MRTTVTVDATNRELNELLDRIAESHGEVVLERGGKAVAMLVPAPEDELARAEARKRLLKLLEELRSTTDDIPDDVLEAEIAEAIREVRAGVQ